MIGEGNVGAVFPFRFAQTSALPIEHIQAGHRVGVLGIEFKRATQVPYSVLNQPRKAIPQLCAEIEVAQWSWIFRAHSKLLAGGLEFRIEPAPGDQPQRVIRFFVGWINRDEPLVPCTSFVEFLFVESERRERAECHRIIRLHLQGLTETGFRFPRKREVRGFG